MQGCITDLLKYKATSEETNFIERIKAPIFLEGVLAIDNVRGPIRFRRESQTQNLKR